jgi:hypothetical protein
MIGLEQIGLIIGLGFVIALPIATLLILRSKYGGK